MYVFGVVHITGLNWLHVVIEVLVVLALSHTASGTTSMNIALTDVLRFV